MKRSYNKIVLNLLAGCLMAAALTACGTKKAALNTQHPTPNTQPSTPNTQQTTANSQFVKKVHDNAVYAKNITAKIDFSIMRGDKEISVGGKLMMRRDEVIRIQLNVPLIGMEAGRLEFTKDYVLIVDRIHSEYVKGDYNQVDFLKRHGLTFSSLQALFWNELTVAGHEKLNDKALQQLKVTLGQPSLTPIALNNGNMSYLWHADNQTALIKDVAVSYGEKTPNSTKLTINYDDFKALGVSMFPSKMNIGMTTNAIKGKARNMKLNITLNNATNNSDWETRTEISKKYKEVSADDVLKILMNL